MPLEIDGIIPPIIVPYDNEEIDETKLRRFIDYVISGGVHGLFPLGTNGEAPLLTLEEKKKVIKITTEHVGDQLPVLAGTGRPSTKSTIELTQFAENVGVDAVCIVNPYYYPTTQEGVVKHYERIAKNTEVPIFVYYIPSKTGNKINVDTMARIAKIPGVMGMKDSSKDISWFYNAVNTIKEKGADFTFLGGSDALIYTHLTLGSRGSVSAVANVFPGLVVNLYEQCVEGNLTKAKEIQDKVLSLRSILKTGPYMSGVKGALKVLGFDFGETREPLRSMSDDQRDQLKSQFQEIGIFDKYSVNS